MAKKKSSLKNPQRGFATTSIVKKKDPEPEQVETKDVPGEAGQDRALESSDRAPNPAAEIHDQNGTSWDDSEEQKEAEEKLAFAERVKAASEKEAARALKTIEYEKRMASSYPEFRWDDPLHLREHIVQLALEEESDKPLSLSKDNDDSEKLIIRIAAISLVLRRLGFEGVQINQCLKQVQELDLDAALDWIYLRHEPDPRNVEIQQDLYKAYGLGTWMDTKIPQARTKQVSSIEETETAAPVRPTALRVTAIEPAASSRNPQYPSVPDILPSQTTSQRPQENELSGETQGSSLLAYRDPLADSSDEDEPVSPNIDKPTISDNADHDDLDPTTVYVATKLKLTSLERKLGLSSRSKKKAAKAKPKSNTPPVSPAELQEYKRLEARLKECERDYLFNKGHAEAIFSVERAKLDKQELAERLAGKAKARSIAVDVEKGETSVSPSQQGSHPSTPPTTEYAKTTDGPDDTIFGALLDGDSTDMDIGEAAPTEENPKGAMIKVRDMALPKSYTAKTPRSLLEDALRRLDKSAKTSYRLISSGRAARAVVSIRWEGGRLQQFGMEDEACENQDQAFHYAATLALFAISPDGSLHRLLPGPYRDLWDELEVRKRQALALVYEQEIANCNDIAAFRAPRVTTEALAPVTDDRQESPKLPVERSSCAPPRRVNEDVLRSEIEARQSSASYQAMLPIRQSLPIYSYREQILSTIEQNQIVILCGETGCGKSTQTPTMILEHELANGRHAKIFCTEPRRISAISLAQRVSQELGETPGAIGTNRSLVGYNIRLESRVASATRLIYATTGIVLRMLEGDTELQDVTHVIIDEVHERSIDSDFLLIILKSLLARRANLRVILMSATVDADKIASYMGPTTPIIQVPGRTFPVTPYFLEDAVELSNYRLEVDSDSPYVDRRSRKHQAMEYNDQELKSLATTGSRMKYQDDIPVEEDDEENEHSAIRSGYSKQTQSTLKAMNEQLINFDLILALLETICFNKVELQPFSRAVLVFLPSLDTIRSICDLLEGHPLFGGKDFQIFPLHSSISNEQQARVFEVPPPGIRKIVVSTNIAETGVTIPDITAVIDSGRHKEMRFDEKRQISKLVECWIARSNALQRRGRAGRVQDGVCFHMFTKARLDTSMAEHPIPEMLRLSLQDLALRIKILKFSGSIEDVLQRALDPPLTANIQRAIASLVDIKALTSGEDITPLGRHLVKLPLDVYTAKFCLLATLFGCLDAALTIAATLNSKSFFVTPFGREMEANTIKRSFRQPDEHSDFLVIYRAYCMWRSNCENGTFYSFARKHFLSHVTLTQIEELKAQYMANLMEAGFISSKNSTCRFSKGPRVRFVQLEPSLNRYSSDSGVIMACVAASMHPKLLYRDAGNGWKTLTNNAPVAIHPSSSNFVHGRKSDLGNANFLTYFNIQQSKKLYVWENGIVDEKSVLLLCGDVDVKHYAHSAALDRKIRRHVERKSGLAIDLLRKHFNVIWLSRLDEPSRPWSKKHRQWFDLLLQAISSTEAEQVKEQQRKAKPSVAINVVRPSGVPETVA